MEFGKPHQTALLELLHWRRDVRHFKTQPVSEAILDRLRMAMELAPAVGNARPWRVVQVNSQSHRAAIIENFERCNRAAATAYDADRRAKYLELKLAGLQQAPIQLAVFTDLAVKHGHGLGRQTMPEMLHYSTVTAIHTLWLAARAENIGLGWVSILDPNQVAHDLAVPEAWALTGYLCLGYPETQSQTPLLDKVGWQANTSTPWQYI